MALISGSLPPQTCYGTPQQLLDLFAQYLTPPTQNIVLEGSLSHTFGTLNSLASATTTFSIAGAATIDVVVVSQPDTGLLVTGRASAPNTITLRATNISGASVASGTVSYRVKVLKSS